MNTKCCYSWYVVFSIHCYYAEQEIGLQISRGVLDDSFTTTLLFAK